MTRLLYNWLFQIVKCSKSYSVLFRIVVLCQTPFHQTSNELEHQFWTSNEHVRVHLMFILVIKLEHSSFEFEQLNQYLNCQICDIWEIVTFKIALILIVANFKKWKVDFSWKSDLQNCTNFYFGQFQSMRTRILVKFQLATLSKLCFWSKLVVTNCV